MIAYAGLQECPTGDSIESHEEFSVGPEMMPVVGSKILRQHSNKDISVIKIKYL